MLARNYHYSLRNNPEERSSHMLRGGWLKASSNSFLQAKLNIFCISGIERLWNIASFSVHLDLSLKALLTGFVTCENHP
jgi:hypothetical protein